jgi:hypothetical protein
MASTAPNRSLFKVNPEILRRPQELYDTLGDNESVQDSGIYIVIVEGWVLYAKKYVFPP